MIPGLMTVVTLAIMMTVEEAMSAEEVAAAVDVMMSIVVADGTLTVTEIMTVETVIVEDMVEMTEGTRCLTSFHWLLLNGSGCGRFHFMIYYPLSQ